MKKVVLLILMFSMAITLCSFEAMAATDPNCSCGPDCDCRLRELTPVERMIIFYEVAAEMGIDITNPAIYSVNPAQSAMQPPAPQSTLAPVYDVGPSPVDSDFIAIEDVELVYVGDGLYRPNIKVRCLYPEGALQVYPQDLDVYCNYLDEEGAVIQSFCGHFKHLSYDQVMWSKANNFSHMNGDDSFDPSEVCQIQFTWYRMRTITGGRVSWQHEWDLLEPVVFNVADLKSDVPINNKDKENQTKGEIVFDEPVLLYEDEKVCLFLNKVFESSKKDGKDADKCLEFNLKNKTEFPISIWSLSFYIDGQELYDSHMQGMNSIQGGQSAVRRFIVRYDTVPERTAPETLEELLVAEGSMSIDVENEEETKIIDSIKLSFSYDLSEYK